jgi:octaprenyl-diphosphate synthase
MGAPAHAGALRSYGHDLGMAFQVADDVLDYTASSSETGKPRGQDLREHKVTLPLIAVLPELSAEERSEVEALFGDPEPGDDRVSRVIGIVREHGGVEYARRRAREFASGAREHLSGLPDGPALRSLEGAVEYVVRRRR